MNTTFATLDSSLRQFTEESAKQEPVSVIIEIPANRANVPSVTVRKNPPVAGQKGMSFHAAPCEQTHCAMDELERFLKKLKVQGPVRLDAAESFVAMVSAEQLKQLADSDLVGKIRPNREHFA